MSAVKAIYAGIRQLGIADEDDRRDLFERITGKRRLREMTPKDKEAVLAELRRMGFAPRQGKAQALSGPYAPKLLALWLSAWNLGIVRDRRDSALIAFAKRQTGLDHVRFLRHADDAQKVISALTDWIAREAGVKWPKKRDPKAMKQAVILAQCARLGVDPGEFSGQSTGTLNTSMAAMGRAIRAQAGDARDGQG